MTTSQQEETQVDHWGEAESALANAGECLGENNSLSLAITQIALVHSQLVIADELKGIKEAIGDYFGDGSNADQIAQALRAIAEPAKYELDPRTLPGGLS